MLPNEAKLALLIGLFYMPPLARVTYGERARPRPRRITCGRVSRRAPADVGDPVRRRAAQLLVSAVIVQATLLIAVGIVVEASLSFIGLGVEPHRTRVGAACWPMRAELRLYGAVVDVGRFQVLAISVGRDRVQPAGRRAPRRTGPAAGSGSWGILPCPDCWADGVARSCGTWCVGFPGQRTHARGRARRVASRLDAGRGTWPGGGESGSGKSQTALAILRLLKRPGPDPESGSDAVRGCGNSLGLDEAAV